MQLSIFRKTKISKSRCDIGILMRKKLLYFVKNKSQSHE